MKKKIFITLLIILTLFITGCTNKSDTEKRKSNEETRTMKYLMNDYIKIYNEASLEAVKNIFPNYYIESAQDIVNQENLDNNKKNNIEKYGKDFKASYKILKEEKMSEEELEELNNKIKESYNTENNATECYKYEGTIILDGSLYDEVISLGTLLRCKYNNKYYLVKKIQ